MGEVLNTIDIMAIDIRRLFGEYCAEYGIEDIAREKQTRFKGAMTYIYRRYFKDTNLLKATPNYVVENSINNMSTNFNAYNLNILLELYLFIKEFANGYDKVASVAVFKELTGISRQCLDNWRNKASCSSLAADKKAFIDWLAECEEDDLKEFNMRNPLGPQERLNVDHGRWERRIMARETHEATAVAAIDFTRQVAALPDSSADCTIVDTEQMSE